MYDIGITHLGIFLISGLISPIVIKLVQYLLAPNIPRLKAANATYECGEKPIGEAQVRFNTQFFTFAIVFVVFDILTILFLLWAFAFQRFSTSIIITALLAMGIFSIPILGGLFFWIKKGSITWV